MSRPRVVIHNHYSRPARDALAMPLKGHPYHTKTDAELRRILKDAEAAIAMQGHSPDAEAKYLARKNDAAHVLYYRSKGGQRVGSV